MFRSDIRLRLEVLWMFKAKARFYRHTNDDVILSQLPKETYSVDTMFRGEQYEPHALFSKGWNQKGFIQGHGNRAVEIGKMLAAGYKNMETAKALGVDCQTVARLRKSINEYRGTPFLCRCGDIGGHQNTKKCHPLLKLPDKQDPPD